MKSLVPVQNLNISDGLKTILAKNYVFFLDDFLSSSIGIFKNHFELTLCDWQSIFEVFRTYKSVKRISDTTIYAAFREKNPQSYNALLINVFDEKYVVATIKNGKWLHDDYIYKSIARGIVFLSREEATSFSEAIAQNNNSKIIEFKIESAQDKIYVINAFSHQKKQSIVCFDRQLDENQIFKAISEGKIFMEPHRAHKLATQAVERINSIYDYEIASLLTLFCDEDNHSAKEIDAIGTENDETCADIDTDDRCVDPKRYSARLKQLYDCTADSFFDWGKNEALSLDAPKRLSRLQKRKLDCIRILEEYKDDAGVTEDDVSYMKGYLEGLNLAIEVYRELQNEEFEASVALIDHFGLLAQMGGEKEAFNSTFVKCNATINAKIFPTLDSANETGVIYDDYYLICSKRLSDAKEDLIYQIQLDFYKATGKTFHLLDLEKNLKSELFSNLFTFDKEKDE